jgi:hypothetical protein
MADLWWPQARRKEEQRAPKAHGRAATSAASATGRSRHGAGA